MCIEHILCVTTFAKYQRLIINFGEGCRILNLGVISFLKTTTTSKVSLNNGSRGCYQHLYKSELCIVFPFLVMWQNKYYHLSLNGFKRVRECLHGQDLQPIQICSSCSRERNIPFFRFCYFLLINNSCCNSIIVEGRLLAFLRQRYSFTMNVATIGSVLPLAICTYHMHHNSYAKGASDGSNLFQVIGFHEINVGMQFVVYSTTFVCKPSLSCHPCLLLQFFFFAFYACLCQFLQVMNLSIILKLILMLSQELLLRHLVTKLGLVRLPATLANCILQNAQLRNVHTNVVTVV